MKKKCLLKIVGASSLAIMMGLGVMVGVVAPLGATSASNGGNLASAAQSPDSALTPQEQLLNGTLELDPENDPVICTTENGLEIRYTQTTITPAKSTTFDHAGQATSPAGLSGYAYLKMGNYNWVIIGYNTSSTTTIVNYNGPMNLIWSDYINYSYKSKLSSNGFAQELDEITPAGIAVQGDATKQNIYISALSIALDYSSAKNNDSELSSGEVLVLCQSNIGKSCFYTDGTTYPKYSSSTLLTVMRNFYYPSTSKNDAGFSESEAALIVPKTLTTAGSSSLTEYLFPLGSTSRASTESFAIENYLTTTAKRQVGSFFWLRSSVGGSNKGVYYNNDDGSINSQNLAREFSVRPAMVVKLI